MAEERGFFKKHGIEAEAIFIDIGAFERRSDDGSAAVLTMVLDVWKIRPDELQILQVGSSPTMLISLQKKLVDGAVLTDPSYFIAQDNGFRVIADLAKMNIHYLQSMMVSTRSYLRTNRDQATRVLRVYVEGIAYFKRNKKESVQIILKKMRMNADQAKYAERTYDQYANLYYERVPYPSPTGIKTVLEASRKTTPKPKGPIRTALWTRAS